MQSQNLTNRVLGAETGPWERVCRLAVSLLSLASCSSNLSIVTCSQLHNGEIWACISTITKRLDLLLGGRLRVDVDVRVVEEGVVAPWELLRRGTSSEQSVRAVAGDVSNSACVRVERKPISMPIAHLVALVEV